MARLLIAVLLALVAVVAAGTARAPRAAGAASLLPGTPLPVLVEQAVPRRCETRLRQGAAGVTVVPYTSPGRGVVTVRTAGTEGDWDLAVFDAMTRRRLGGSATFGSRETATALVDGPRRLALQLCRRRGASVSLPLAVEFFAITSTERPQPGRLVSVAVDSPEDIGRLEDLGLDVTHHATDRSVDVILYRASERTRLRRAGFRWRTKVADLGAQDRRDRAAERASARRAQARALPSGRTLYRTYEEYGADLTELVETYPGHVRRVTLPEPSLEGRPLEGVEIAAEVGRVGDGRPIFLLGGLTHAREWPAGELAIEFAIDLAKSYGTDPRVTELLQKTRVIVLPVLNPDGYVVSRTAGEATPGGDDTPPEGTLGMAVGDAGAYKRKNCRARTPEEQATPCASRAPFGVDLNRAYGAFWGGDGSSSDNTTQQYRGTEPFSEPEARAVRRFGAANQIQTFITNHTFTDGRILRQPGFDVENDPVPPVLDEEPIFVRLGDQMADATGYISELGYATLGNITGPSDDFLFYSQGTIGYTPEMRGSNFHTNFADAVIGEYEGEGTKVGRGWREAYLDATEQAGDPADHSVIEGSAPAGRVLRLRKTTQLTTSDDEDGNGEKDKEPIVFDETVDTTLTVPAAGRYEWHVNPSTRPLAPAKEAFTLTCEAPDGTVIETQQVEVDRGEAVTRDLACGTSPSPPPPPPPPPATPPPATPPRTPPGRPGLEPDGQTPGVAGTPVNSTPRTVRMIIRRGSASVRRLVRRRALAIFLRFDEGPLTDVRVRLVDRAGRTVAAGRRTRLGRSARVLLRLARRPRPGLHAVVVTGRDASGRPVTAKRSARLRR